MAKDSSFTFSHFADAFIQSDYNYNWGIHKAINLEEANRGPLFKDHSWRIAENS